MAEHKTLSCDNRWHFDPSWTIPYCPSCESRERTLVGPKSAHHDAHVIEKRRHGGNRGGEVSYYVVGPVRETLEEAELDLSVWRMRDG